LAVRRYSRQGETDGFSQHGVRPYQHGLADAKAGIYSIDRKVQSSNTRQQNQLRTEILQFLVMSAYR
jgi:hypothetical protein